MRMDFLSVKYTIINDIYIKCSNKQFNVMHYILMMEIIKRNYAVF